MKRTKRGANHHNSRRITTGGEDVARSTTVSSRRSQTGVLSGISVINGTSIGYYDRLIHNNTVPPTPSSAYRHVVSTANPLTKAKPVSAAVMTRKSLLDHANGSFRSPDLSQIRCFSQTTGNRNTGDLLRSKLPIVAAPMAGGPSTVALAHAVAKAGGFPFLAGGYKTQDALASEIQQLRALSTGFGVNLFVPSADPVDMDGFTKYVKELQCEADHYGLKLNPIPVTDDDDGWRDKMELLVRHPVPVVSLTFGLPATADIVALQKVGTKVLATVTTPHEASLAFSAGVDGLVVQGPSAGGHSATFDPNRSLEMKPTADVVREVLQAVNLPIIAAGGVDGPKAVQELLESGAQAVAVGTLLLRSAEAGTSPTHRHALGDPAFTETVYTRSFTGRPARALRNGFIDRHPRGISAYPAVHHLTRDIRQAAGKAGDTDRLHLWAGTGWRNAPEGPAADIIQYLAQGV